MPWSASIPMLVGSPHGQSAVHGDADTGWLDGPLLNLWFIFKTSGELIKMYLSKIHPELDVLGMIWSDPSGGRENPK